MVTIEQVATKYPLLWHMADPRNVDGILERGLLSTSALLDLMRLSPEERYPLERARRSDDVVLTNPEVGTVVLRDQKPLNIARLGTALTEGTVEDFLAFINQRVFFWPTEARLSTMNGARAYIEHPQLVLIVRTASLLAAHKRRVRLSRINSGATMPFAVARSVGTFATMPDYDWSSGKRQIAEITIENHAMDIWQHIDRLEVWRGGTFVKRLVKPWNATLNHRINS